MDHGTLARTIDANLDEAHEVMRRLAAVGIDMDQVTEQLEIEGVQSFSESYTKLRESIAGKRDALLVGQAGASTGTAS